MVVAIFYVHICLDNSCTYVPLSVLPLSLPPVLMDNFVRICFVHFHFVCGRCYLVTVPLVLVCAWYMFGLSYFVFDPLLALSDKC